MTVLYLFGIKIFHFLIIIASLFNLKAKLWLNGRKKLFEELSKNIQSDDNIVWFHCASLGEFEQGRPVIELLKEKYPEFKILLTFYSPSGYEIQKNCSTVDWVYYLPLDTPKKAKRFLSIVNPKLVFFIKYEFWYFFLREIEERNIPLYLVSGIFRKNQRFFKKWNFMSRKMLTRFTHFFVQNDESEQLLKSININNVSVTGDTRFDRVSSIMRQSKDLPLIEKFATNSIVLIAGSTWRPDEEIIIKYFNECSIPFKLIIAPHEIHKENINRIIQSVSKIKHVILNSELNDDNVLKADLLIIDSIGLLSSIYKYGQIAYIGGGFGKGIHNTLEAATFGMPIIVGPNYQNFQEAVDLINLGGAYSISNFSDFKDKFNLFIEKSTDITKLGKISSDYVNYKQGASLKILKLVDMSKK